MLSLTMRAVGLVVCLSLSGLAQAKLGADQSANGVANWRAGALPASGSFLIVNSGFYGGTLRDGKGRKLAGSRASVWFSANRYVRMTGKRLWGANYGWQLVVPVVQQEMRIGGLQRSRAGVADITLNPLILAWQRNNLHWVFGLDVIAPTGSYDSREPRRSIGSNHWSLEPLLATTWLSDGGWEVSAKFMYNIKTKNRAYRATPRAGKQSYHSGQDFHVDYLLGRHFGRWGVGVAGYYLKQTTSDRVSGHTVAGTPAFSSGRRGQVLAYGPALSYSPRPGLAFSLQWNHESRVRNRFAGDRATFKLVLPL